MPHRSTSTSTSSAPTGGTGTSSTVDAARARPARPRPSARGAPVLLTLVSLFSASRLDATGGARRPAMLERPTRPNGRRRRWGRWRAWGRSPSGAATHLPRLLGDLRRPLLRPPGRRPGRGAGAARRCGAATRSPSAASFAGGPRRPAAGPERGALHRARRAAAVRHRPPDRPRLGAVPGRGRAPGAEPACAAPSAARSRPRSSRSSTSASTYDYPLSVFADGSNPDRQTIGSHAARQAHRPDLGATPSTPGPTPTPRRPRSDAVIEDLRVLGLPVLDVLQLVPLQDLQLDTSVANVDSAKGTHRPAHRRRGRSSSRPRPRCRASSSSAASSASARIRVRRPRITDDGAGQAHRRRLDVEVTGVTVAGVPAQITEDGLVLGSPSGCLRAARAAAAIDAAHGRCSTALGVKVTLLGDRRRAPTARARRVASAGGLLLEINLRRHRAAHRPRPARRHRPQRHLRRQRAARPHRAPGRGVRSSTPTPRPRRRGRTDVGVDATTGGDVRPPTSASTSPAAAPSVPGDADEPHRPPGPGAVDRPTSSAAASASSTSPSPSPCSGCASRPASPFPPASPDLAA